MNNLVSGRAMAYFIHDRRVFGLDAADRFFMVSGIALGAVILFLGKSLSRRMNPGMHRNWEFSHCDGFDCPHCGAVYSVRYTQLPIRDSESAYCENCHRKMSQWHSTARPWYTLIARPERQHV